ncbi:MAG: amicyanin [Mesorhizobium sp.]|uniref:cupredoxin domain-containing protein n=1 Tax=Mesorhizobium sp. TaxID=1871066 RepID=UPI00120EF959|nr:cupredoxin family copper-binding protein [Mesorhizobium sp.]TIN91895.1 MAG: amicyanin [Mesorhizobium sp.]TJV00955.1 MAG: amicyanin [Mesorhizobium sp.]
MKAGASNGLLFVAALALVLAAVPAAAATIRVTIDKLVFSPDAVEAKVGDTIEWVNKDVIAHTATVKGGWEVMIPPRKSASLTLKAAGTVDYFCRFHPNMKGRLLVSP